MRTSRYSGARALAAAALLGLAAACAEAPTTLSLAAPTDAALDRSASGFSVVHLRLRPAEDSESSASGELTVFVGVLLPPNPCGETLQEATIAVCGVIRNPGDEELIGGFLIVQASRDAAPVRLEFAVPPNPCLTYLVQASIAADLGTEKVGTPTVQAEFTFEGGTIVSLNPQPEPPSGPGGRRGTNAGPPNAPPNPCLVGFATRTG